jgi:hypothetical protein
LLLNATLFIYGDALQARALQGFAVAPVLGWQAFGFIIFKLMKACQPSTNPYDPYRWLRDLRLAIAIYD